MASLTNRFKTGARAEGGDAALVERLRAGDEAAFAEVVDRYGPSMLRVARPRWRCCAAI